MDIPEILHSTDGQRRQHGDGLIERALWSAVTAVLANLLLLGVQAYVSNRHEADVDLIGRVSALEKDDSALKAQMADIPRAIESIDQRLGRIEQGLQHR